jgi:uncharacterized protein
MQSGFEFGGQNFVIAADAALFWPDRKALLVADLHLEKGSSFAAHTGQMLPPYDSIDTLRALSVCIEQFRPETVYCLGDNYHDDGGEARLSMAARTLLTDLTGRLDWNWIVGNHDPALQALWGGRLVNEVQIAGIVLRHEADPNCKTAEITGHFHPKLRIRQTGRNIARRCFVANHRKLIMPAFGAFTGGLDAGHDAIKLAMGHENDPATAMLAVDNRILRFPLEREPFKARA